MAIIEGAYTGGRKAVVNVQQDPTSRAIKSVLSKDLVVWDIDLRVLDVWFEPGFADCYKWDVITDMFFS